MKNLNVILHATDFSPNAQAALTMACELARRREANLVVLHVAHPVPCHWPGSSPSVLHSCEHWREADRDLRNLDCGALLPERMLRTGEPAAVIVSVAERIDANLIVLGQPRPGKWRWLLEERVAQTVVRRAPRPVLVVAGPTAETRTAREIGDQAARDSVASLEYSLAATTGKESDRYGLFERHLCGATRGYLSCRQAAAR